MKYTDPRMLFGFGVLLAIVTLALVIALGTVRQDTSHGLEIVLGMLGPLAGGFAQWAFGKKDEPAK